VNFILFAQKYTETYRHAESYPILTLDTEGPSYNTGTCSFTARMEAASDYPFLDYPRTAPRQDAPGSVGVVINCHCCALYPALAFVIIEAGIRGVRKKQPQRKPRGPRRGQQLGAAGMPNFYHIQRIMQRQSRSWIPNSRITICASGTSTPRRIRITLCRS
jgi:hypothetical protein